MEEGALHLISGRFLPAAALDLETPDALSFTIPLEIRLLCFSHFFHSGTCSET